MGLAGNTEFGPISGVIIRQDHRAFPHDITITATTNALALHNHPLSSTLALPVKATILLALGCGIPDVDTTDGAALQ